MDTGRTGLTLDAWTVVLGAFALGNVGSGVWMLADPAHLVMSSIMSDKMHISYGLKIGVFTGFLAFLGVLAW